MKTTWLIVRRCKCSNVFSWPILIDRGLELPKFSIRTNFLSFAFLLTIIFIRFSVDISAKKMRFTFAPLAQLVEQLTLNQWVPGSNPWRCTRGHSKLWPIVSVFNAEGPPVPIPNTEVKLCSAENTYLATDRENRSLPTYYKGNRICFPCNL